MMFLRKFLKRVVIILFLWFAGTLTTGVIYAGLDWTLLLKVGQVGAAEVATQLV